MSALARDIDRPVPQPTSRGRDATPLILAPRFVHDDLPAPLNVGFELSPPSVQPRQVEPPVDEDLHPARAASLPRPPRCVEPYVDAGHEVLSKCDIVVLQKDNTIPDIGACCEACERMDQAFTFLIIRVRFSRDD